MRTSKKRRDLLFIPLSCLKGYAMPETQDTTSGAPHRIPLGVRISPNLRKALDAYCKKSGRSQSAAVEMLLALALKTYT